MIGDHRPTRYNQTVIPIAPPSTMSLTPAEKAIALIQQLPPDQQAAALDYLKQMAQKPYAGFDEASLIEIIQRPSPIDPDRLEDLRDRDNIGLLKPAEELELQQAPIQLERHNIDRLQAMIQLAQLRSIDLPTLAAQLQTAIPQVFGDD
jgi:hypothetical protein